MSTDESGGSAQLYDLAPCGLLVTTDDGTILRANATVMAWTGYSADELVGRTFHDLLDRGARIFYETRFLPVLHLQGEAQEIALTLSRADGSTFPVLVNARARTSTEDGADGTVDGAVDIAVFDTSERQDFERQLVIARRTAEESEKRTRILQDATAVFGGKETPEDLAQALAESARVALDATAAAVFLGDDEPRLSGGTVPVDAALLPGGIPPGPVAPGSILLVSLDQDDLDPGLHDALREARLDAIARVPLTDGETPVGDLVFYFARHPELDEALEELVRALGRQAVQTLTRIRLQEQLAAIALYDQLTGLANRVLLRTHITASVAAAVEQDQPLALIFVDLDDFKSINDELGHAAGDTVLKLTATRLTGAVRSEDLVCRYGGDEFVIVCRNTDERIAERIAERIRSAVRQPLYDEGWQRTITASVGVTVHASSSAHLLNGPELLRVADKAMYRSKDLGKDRVTLITR